MKENNIRYSDNKKVFLIQPLTAESYKFISENILKEKNAQFYKESNTSVLECIGNSFFCTSQRNAEYLSNTLRTCSDNSLSFMLIDVTNNLSSWETASIQLRESVSKSTGADNLMDNYCTGLMVLDDTTRKKRKMTTKRKKLKLLLQLKLALKKELYERAAEIRDELIALNQDSGIV